MGDQSQATILFSDIRNFTAFTAQKGDRQALHLLKLHNQIAQQTIDTHDGRLIKTYGDGMMARFAQPIQALDAAIGLQVEFNNYTQQHPAMPLLVGMGIHHGDVIEENEDLFGLTVNFAKRMADEARSGQIVISETLLSHLPEFNRAYSWNSLGSKSIKGVGQINLFEVIWRDEAMRLTTEDQMLNLILTQNDKLVIELGKHARTELDQIRKKMKEKSQNLSGFPAWILEKSEAWLPRLIDKALLKAGVGIEHSLENIQLRFVEEGARNKLFVKIGKKEFDFSQVEEKGFDKTKLKTFIDHIHRRQATLVDWQAGNDAFTQTDFGKQRLFTDNRSLKQRTPNNLSRGEGSLLKQLFISLSENQGAQKAFTSWPLARRVVSRFVAGEYLEQAIKAVRTLNRNDIFATLDYLGEETKDPAAAARATEEYVTILETISDEGVQATVSLKPTQLGLSISDELFMENMKRLLHKAKELDNAICIDMEGSSYTQRTLDLFDQLFADFDNVSTVIQSNLRRSERDVSRLIDLGASVRMVKGAYLEPADIAFQRKQEVDRAYVRLTEQLLSCEAREKGVFTAIATHDEQILRWMCQHIIDQEIPTSSYEFQMLYGIRQDLQQQLADAGHTVRVYVSYGTEWYPYFMRRLAERPANVLFLLKNLFR